MRAERFEQVVLAHLDAAYNLARWLTGRSSDAEDVVQEAMLRAFRAFDGCREATVRPWLLRIVRNTAYDWMTSVKTAKLCGFADIDPDDADGAAFVADAFTEPAETPESLMMKADDRRLMDTLIAGLPIVFREIVVLRELEELSYKEIAEISGIPLGTVMSRLARARDLLQKAWRVRNAG
jgi:RNA polymerase sigma-70 factor (ECF subfamily)